MKILCVSLVLILCSCANSMEERLSFAEDIAGPAGMQGDIVKTDNFQIKTYTKIYKQAAAVNIYIEGDGLAWVDRGRLSSNPTPRDPMGLRLAAADTSDNVIYLARPCQYISFKSDFLCEGKFWSGSRFSDTVISSMNQAISKLKAHNNFSDINIIGYSGGAAVAAIIASKRTDVISIRTVAGNLDHNAVNQYHKVDLLDDSLNAIDFAKYISHIPQYHFSGSDDTIIPAFIAENFTKRINGYANGYEPCAKNKLIAKATHHSGWQEKWQILLAEDVSCNAHNLMRK